MPVLPITSTLSAVLAVMLVMLSVAVSLRRGKVGTDIGIGADEQLLRRIRAQGNFIEYVPLALILCAVAELRGVGLPWLWTIALLLFLGRLSHATGMLIRSTPLRAIGMLATYAALLVGAVAQVVG